MVNNSGDCFKYFKVIRLPTEEDSISAAVTIALDENPSCSTKRKSNAIFYILCKRETYIKDGKNIPPEINSFIEKTSRKSGRFNIAIFLKNKGHYNPKKSRKSYLRMEFALEELKAIEQIEKYLELEIMILKYKKHIPNNEAISEAIKMAEEWLELKETILTTNEQYKLIGEASKDLRLSLHKAACKKWLSKINTKDKLNYALKYFRQNYKFWDFIYNNQIIGLRRDPRPYYL